MRCLSAALLLVVGCGGNGSEMDGGLIDSGPGDAGTPADAAADVSEPQPCDDPGVMRTASCGNCGLVSQVCGDDGLWQDMSECLDQGVCAAGEVEEEMTPMCGRRSRICDDECSWRDWTELEPDGECEAGATRLVDDTSCPSGTRTETCTDECAWESGSCGDECDSSGRVTPADAAEVCIPEGTFIRGIDDSILHGSSDPQTEVFISAFYIDKYPVTNDRYRDCVDDGACGLPADEPGLSSFNDPGRGRFPAQTIRFTDAEAFCEWDGRRLPTEAEWEKAARGPAPRDQLFPWGNENDCERLYSAPCGWTPPDGSPTGLIHDEIDAWPDAASVYGVHMLVEGGAQWTSDWFSREYYSDPDSLEDPQGPDGDINKAVRGRIRQHNAYNFHVVYRNTGSADGDPRSYSTVRCARSVGE